MTRVRDRLTFRQGDFWVITAKEEKLLLIAANWLCPWVQHIHGKFYEADGRSGRHRDEVAVAISADGFDRELNDQISLSHDLSLEKVCLHNLRFIVLDKSSHLSPYADDQTGLASMFECQTSSLLRYFNPFSIASRMDPRVINSRKGFSWISIKVNLSCKLMAFNGSLFFASSGQGNVHDYEFFFQFPSSPASIH